MSRALNWILCNAYDARFVEIFLFRPVFGVLLVNKLLIVVCIALSLLGVMACSPSADRVEIDTVATRSPHRDPVDLEATSRERFGFAVAGARGMGMANPGQTASGVSLHWTTPEGWAELPATQFRTANFQLGANLETECYVSILPGGGGGLLGNVNRWRGQMGVEPYTEAAFAALPTKMVFGQPALYLDFEGTFTGMGQAEPKDGYRLLGALSLYQGDGVFVKMVGPAADLAEQVEAFDVFLGSLHFAAGEHNHGNAQPAPSPATQSASVGTHNADADAAGGFAWRVPKGWTRGADRSMRLVTYTVGETECYITVLSGDGGGMPMNLNRWLGQLGLPPLSEETLQSLPPLDVLGAPAPLLEAVGVYTGMGSEPRPGTALLGVASIAAGQGIFIKMIGPEAEVATEKENFIAFCESLHAH